MLRLQDGRVAIDVAYGAVARQTRFFADALAAVQWAEALRECLESIGYRPHRQHRRQRRQDLKNGEPR